MRLFAALVPPPPVVDHLHAVVAALRAEHGDWRWASPERWHLTLAFYGAVAEAAVPALTERLARAAGRHPPQDLTLAGAGRFDGRVLWVGVDGDRLRLRRLAQATQAAAQRAGVAVDPRPFRAHLTVARTREPVDLRPAVERLAAYQGPIWTADALHLVRSTLGPHPRYDDVARWELTGRPTN